jgi:hydroxyacylglutathione hydrolase
VGVIVDPVETPDHYLRAAAEVGVDVRYVVDTHVHADHLSMGLNLARIVGARYLLHESVEAAFEFERVADGAQLDAGNVRIDILHLPGHTPEHIGLLVTDRKRTTEPWLVFTGHTLMVGDMGRTELATSADVGARALFASAQRLKRLPDYVSVLPGAFSGSVCGRALSGNPASTIGFERRFNKSFAIDDEATFVEAMMRDIPPAPPAAVEMRIANLRYEHVRR